MDINLIVLEGRLTRNAEMKSAGSSTVTTFSIANNRGYKKDGQWVDNSFFFDCEIWGPFGESIRQYLNKGQKITVTGELVQNRWNDKDGKIRTSDKIRVKDLSIQFEKKQNQNETEPKITTPAPESSPEGIPEEIPF